ncbi:hypothetical protein DSM07_03480 [Oenococcus sp. UCMA 16435]|nr:hypothetical protein DSM07_03480 [Oenococcus sp. UCMA 16435]
MNLKDNHSFAYKVVFIFVGITPLLDSLNGFITMYLPGPLEQFVPAVRLFILILMLFCIFSLNFSAFCYDTITIFLVISIVFLQSFFIDPTNNQYVSQNMSQALKVCYFCILLDYFLLISKKNDIFSDIMRIVRVISYSMPLLIIFPKELGLGRQTYESSNFGSSGFFIANNSSNFTLIISTFLLVFLIGNDIYTKSKIFDFIFLILSFYALYLQSTKSGLIMIGIILSISIFKFFNMLIHKITIVKSLFLVFSILFFFFLVILILSKINYILYIISTSLSSLIERQRYLYQISGGNLFEVITSGRISNLNSIFNYFSQKPNYGVLILGAGQGYIANQIGHISEMDFFDLYFYFGILGVFITYVKSIMSIMKVRIFSLNYISIKLMILFSFIYSFFAGHVFVEIISSTMIILLIMILITGYERLTSLKKIFNENQVIEK